MSISTNTPGARKSNPFFAHLEFRAKKGHFTYWNGEAEVEMDSVEFVVLDSRYCVTGYNKKLESAIYSNHVVSTAKEPFVVRAGVQKGVGPIAEGLWKDIKMQVAYNGGKFTHKLFVMANIDGEYQLCTFKMAGTACNSWIDLTNDLGGKYEVHNYLIVASVGEKAENGDNSYHNIQFSSTDIPEPVLAAAIDMDMNKLQPWLTAESPADSSTADNKEEAAV